MDAAQADEEDLGGPCEEEPQCSSFVVGLPEKKLGVYLIPAFAFNTIQ